MHHRAGRRRASCKTEFDKRNVKVVGLSVDPVESHRAWAADIAETQGAAVNFPLIADPDRKVADLYDMIHPNASDTVTVRSVFVIGPDKKVKLTLTYPASTGRNFDEILRVHRLAAADRRPPGRHARRLEAGEDVIITPGVSDEEAARRFPDHRVIKPYLRLTPQPTASDAGEDRDGR